MERPLADLEDDVDVGPSGPRDGLALDLGLPVSAAPAEGQERVLVLGEEARVVRLPSGGQNDTPELGLGEGAARLERDAMDLPLRPFHDREADVDGRCRGVARDLGPPDPRLRITELPVGAEDGVEGRARIVDQIPEPFVLGQGEAARGLRDGLRRQGLVSLDGECADTVAGALGDRDLVDDPVPSGALSGLDPGLVMALPVEFLEDEAAGLVEIDVLREEPGPAFPDGSPRARRDPIPAVDHPHRIPGREDEMHPRLLPVVGRGHGRADVRVGESLFLVGLDELVQGVAEEGVGEGLALAEAAQGGVHFPGREFRVAFERDLREDRPASGRPG